MNSETAQVMEPEAEYAQALEDGRIECRLCPHHCVMIEGKSGRCHVRGVRGGRLRALGYGALSAVHVDPVEKKPLYHFLPGEPVFSIGAWGCNFACAFCQNWEISQQFPPNVSSRTTPAAVVANAQASGCRMIAYTYNEPLTGFEFVRDCARLARQAGLKNVLVTNGYVEEDPAAELLPLLDALNVDVKSMEDTFYRQQCHATLEPVLRFCRQARTAGCHLELTNLVIPGLNDRPELFDRLADWVAETLGPKTPLHLSAYHPDFRTSEPPTPIGTLIDAQARCRAKLSYVYVGNVASDQGHDTICPDCGATLVTRSGYRTKMTGIRSGACAGCKRAVDLVLFAGTKHLS